MDSNRPSHWQVFNSKTEEVVADNLTHKQALELCLELDPEIDKPGNTLYNMRPVR